MLGHEFLQLPRESQHMVVRPGVSKNLADERRGGDAARLAIEPLGLGPSSSRPSDGLFPEPKHDV